MDKSYALAASRGKTLVVQSSRPNYEQMDNSDGLGPYISVWSIAELGGVPTEADGFTADELRNPDKLNTTPPTSAVSGTERWVPGDTFVERMSNQELKGTIDTTASDNTVRRWFELIRMRNQMNTVSQQTTSAKAALIANGTFTQARADIVFAPLPP